MNKPIQIVDQKGQSVGVAKSPFMAIRAGQIRLLARVVITDGNGRYLLQKRDKDMRMYPDCWDTSAAGHVDEGETVQQAGSRELFEEIGLNVPLSLIYEYYDELYIRRYDMTFKSYSYVYGGQFDGNINDLVLQEKEVAAVKWASREEIKEIIANHPEKCTDGLIKIFGQDIV